MKKDGSMKEIEQLLKLAPEVNDTRTKDEVLARLKKEGVFHESTPFETKEVLPKPQENEAVLKRTKGSRMATVVVAAVALFIFGGAAGFLLSQNKDSAMDEASTGADMMEMNNIDTMESADEGPSNRSSGVEAEISSIANAVSYIPNSSLVWESDLQWASQLKLGLVTEQLDVVPVTVLVDRNQPLTETNSYLTLYNAFAAQIDEEGLGFIPYHPLEGRLQEGNGEQGELIHILNENHPYDVGSASEIVYKQVLNETFRIPFLKVSIIDEDGLPVEFAHTGQIGQLALENERQRPYFVMNVGGSSYIAPVNNLEIDHVEQALQQLTEVPPHANVESPIVAGVSYTTSFDSDIVTVTFTEALDLSQYDQADIATMFDAIIMTAASYGTRIQFENVVDTPENSYPLSEPIEEPIGTNKIILNSN